MAKRVKTFRWEILSGARPRSAPLILSLMRVRPRNHEVEAAQAIGHHLHNLDSKHGRFLNEK
jgi:hypothetical protein